MVEGGGPSLRDLKGPLIRPEKVNPVRGNVEGNDLAPFWGVRTVQFDHEEREALGDLDMKVSFASEIFHDVYDPLHRGRRAGVLEFDMFGPNSKCDPLVRLPTVDAQREDDSA